MEKFATMLTSKYVSILTIKNGTNNRKIYENSEEGRQTIINSEPDYIVKEVMEVWGDKPTVIESEYNFDINNMTDANSNVWDAIAKAVRTGVNEL